MTEQRRSGDPRFMPHQSFIRPNPDNMQFVLAADINMLLREQERVTDLVTNPGLMLTYFADLAQRTSYGRSESKRIAEVEATAILMANPQFVYRAPSFMSLYRLLRFAELYGNAKRGGNVFLIGSGFTIAEYMAANAQPPSETTVANLFFARPHTGLLNAVAESMRKTVGNEPMQFVGSLKTGKTVAIEPDTEEIDTYHRKNAFFGIPPSACEVLPLTLGEAFAQEGTIPSDLDMVIWHRADSAIILPDSDRPLKLEGKAKRKRNWAIKNTLEQLLDHQKSGGSLVITVGTGNNRIELAQRESFIKDVYNILSRSGTVDLVDLPVIFNDRVASFADKDFFQDSSFGAIGCVVAVKK